MVYNRAEVVERALAVNGTLNVPNTCQAWTRAIIGVHAVGDVDGDGDADAVDGWRSEPIGARHYDRNPPAGVPGAWSGGRNGFGHRAVSIGNGRFVSTDAGGTGRIAIVTLDWFERNWGMKWLGWSDTMSGVPIPKVKQRQSNFDVIDWNVNVKSSPILARGALVTMINKFSPDALYLYEGAHLYGELGGLGYQAYHLKGKVQGNIVALVRNNHTVKKSRTIRMREFWVGPIMGRPQKPRIYRALKIEKRNVMWKIVGVHFPFGQKARRESVLWLRKLLTVAKRPVIAFGDYNFNASNVNKNIAKPSGSKVAGSNIELAVYKNCELVKETVIGDWDLSDHPAIYRRFVK